MAKRIEKNIQGIDRAKFYSLDEAVKLVKERANAKFNETIEVAMNLGVDPRHSDQMVRGVVNLPNGTGRTVRVGVFAKGAKAEEAKKAGADVIGAEGDDGVRPLTQEQGTARKRLFLAGAITIPTSTSCAAVATAAALDADAGADGRPSRYGL